MAPTFEFLTVVHLTEPTGSPMRTLRELREGIAAADAGTLFHLTHEPLLRDVRATERPATALAHWCEHVLLSAEAAERVESAAEARGQGMEPVRDALLHVLSELDRGERARRVVPEAQGLRLYRWRTLGMRSGLDLGDPAQPADVVAALGPAQFFHHFIEARQLRPGTDEDFIGWLATSGAARRAESAERALARARSLAEARLSVLRAWRRGGIASRVARAAELPEAARRGEAHELLTNLVRGRRGGNGWG